MRLHFVIRLAAAITEKIYTPTPNVTTIFNVFTSTTRWQWVFAVNALQVSCSGHMCYYLRLNHLGSFWHDGVRSCMPEGQTPCVDRCLEDSTHSRGCYAGLNCRQFFVCSNTGSYGMCCPSGTSFHEDSCSCETDDTCMDGCVQLAPPVPTTVAPAQTYNDTVCIDSYGTYIRADAEPNAYHLIDEAGHSSGKQFCINGYGFNLVTCRCDIESGAAAPPQQGLRRVALYLQFDSDVSDVSIQKFTAFRYDGADVDTSFGAYGGGSLIVNGGHVEVPGLQGWDARASASWCAFFYCNGQCVNSGIVGSGVDSSSTDKVILGITGPNTVSGYLYMWHPVGDRVLSANFQTPSNGWNQVCLTYDGNTANLWVNGAIGASENLGGFFHIGDAPFVIGNNQQLGTFNGHIDEVLVAPFALTPGEVNAYRIGDRAWMQSQGFY